MNYEVVNNTSFKEPLSSFHTTYKNLRTMDDLPTVYILYCLFHSIYVIGKVPESISFLKYVLVQFVSIFIMAIILYTFGKLMPYTVLHLYYMQKKLFINELRLNKKKKKRKSRILKIAMSITLLLCFRVLHRVVIAEGKECNIRMRIQYSNVSIAVYMYGNNTSKMYLIRATIKLCPIFWRGRNIFILGARETIPKLVV